MEKIKLATAWLDGCSGCHMSVLDIDETILSIADRIEMVYGPLVDHKEIPEGIDVAIIEGAVSSEDDLAKVRQIRERSAFVIALGDCAVTSNVPSMRNQYSVKAIMERVYHDPSVTNPVTPTEGVPPLLHHARPLHEYIKIDLHVPGCPPPPGGIAYVLTELLEGRHPDIETKLRFG